MSDITCTSVARLPRILSGVPEHPLEDIKISNVFFEQAGGGTAEMAALQPEEREAAYPDPDMFGELPATGIFARHVRGLDISNVEVVSRASEARPAFWLRDVEGADFFNVRVPQGAAAFALHKVKEFRSFGSRRLADVNIGSADERSI
jgi:polygalacturonase